MPTEATETGEGKAQATASLIDLCEEINKLSEKEREQMVLRALKYLSHLI